MPDLGTGIYFARAEGGGFCEIIRYPAFLLEYQPGYLLAL
jgi:hypothetical protein